MPNIGKEEGRKRQDKTEAEAEAEAEAEDEATSQLLALSVTPTHSWGQVRGLTQPAK